MEVLSPTKHLPGGRLSTITVDQAIAGGSNVLIAVLAARLLGVESFGLFGIVFLVYVSAQGAMRALVCEPLLVRSAEAEERPGEAIGTALVLGLALGFVVLLAGLGAQYWDGRLGNALIVLAALLPLMALQDLGRYLGFATRRPSFALAVDISWLVLVVVAAGCLIAGDAKTLTWFIAAWAGSGGVAGLVVLWQHRGHRVAFGRSWLRESWMFSWRYLTSFAIMQGGVLVATVALTAIAGAGTLGGVRGALLLMSVSMTFQIAAGASGVVDIAQCVGSDGVRQHANRIAVLTTGVAVLNTVLLLVMPDSWGAAVLGDSWGAAEPLLLPAGIQVSLLGLMLGARAGLLGSRAVAKTMAVDLVFTPVLVGAAVAGALVGGGLGYYWSIVIAQGLAVILWWSVFWFHLRRIDESGNVEIMQGELH